jgi:thiol-disulfide isomerase/thioredoxin
MVHTWRQWILPLLAILLVACDEADRVGEANDADATAGALHSIVLARLDGGEERLSRYGSKTVVLNVWATWCPPCRAELPSLQRLSGRLDPERFVVAGLSVDEDSDFVREYLNDVGVGYVNYIDSAQTVVRDVLGVESFPQTLLIGARGTLRDRIVGARDWGSPEVVAALEKAAER